MVKVKATLNAKAKISKDLQVSDRQNLINQIQELFNIDPTTIVFMKPALKDQDQFVKNIKEGVQILFRGNQKKQLTAEQIEAQNKKQQELKRKLQQAKKKIQQSKIDQHKKILQRLTKQNIKERGFSFMNQNGQIENLHTDHYTSPVHLMRIAPQFKKFCVQYKVQPKNPDGLLIEELGKAFRSIQNEPEKMVDPLDWCSAFIAYCADDIDYPYPTYDFNYILTKVFQTVQNAHITQAERKEPNSTPNLFGPGNTWFALDLNFKKTKLTKLDQDDYQAGKQFQKRQIRYVLECDLSSEQTKTIQQGIRKRFEKKIVWENFYAFDLEYQQTIVSIQRPPKYLFVHTNRVGYPPSKDQSQEIVLLPNAKSKHRIRTKLILDLSQFCSNSLKDRLQNGKFERYQLFHRLSEQQAYPQFIQKLKLKYKGLNIQTEFTENQLKYLFFDDKLFENDIFHEYYFDQLKGSKQTGQYRLVGVVFHKGPYYHHPDSSHKKQTFGHGKSECRGEFMIMVYKQGTQWLKFHDAEVSKVDLQEVLHQKYWGDGQWTPALCMYREIYIKNIEIQVFDD